MDNKKRPVGREKHVTGGTAHVGRRDSDTASGGGSSSGGVPPYNNGAKRNGGGSSPLKTLLILAAVLLFGGGGALSTLLGGSSGTGTGTNAPTGTNTSTGQTTPSSTTGTHAATNIALNTSVAAEARDKRVVLQGDGSDTTTIMVYMCGTDLESNGGFATSDLQEMTAATIGDSLNVLVFTGGCKQWKNTVVNSSKNQIYQVKDGGLSLLWESNTLQPMTNPDTLSGFIRWGVKNCPATRYSLIFWDHGGGSVSGYGYDEMYPQAGSMTLDGIAQALKDGGCLFDFVGFDACLMATLETALVAEPYADYLIASEETEPGCGWYYTNWLTALSQNPSMPALEIGKQIADDFVRVCGQVASRQQATLSVIDLAELSGTVPDPFRSFAQSTAQTLQAGGYQEVAAARSNAKEFAASSHIDQVDLIHLAENMDTDESRTLAKVLRSAVKYNTTSRNIQNACGVSIYFPYGRTSNVTRMTETYARIGVDSSYSDCIRRFASVEVAGQTVSGGQSAQLDSLFGALLSGGNAYASSSTNSGEVIAQLLGGLLAGNGRSLAEVNLSEEEAAFLDDGLIQESSAFLEAHQFDPSALAWTEKNGQRVLALTDDQWELVQDVELNVFVDDGEGYIDLGLDNVFDLNGDGDLIGTYDQTWLAVNGQIVAYYLLSSQGTQDDYTILGRIPAYLNGQRVDLIASFTSENPDGEILGAAPCYGDETDTVAKGLLPIQEGDRIDFLCDYYDYDRNYQDAYYLGEPLTVSGSLALSNIQMDNTQYIAAYRLTDIYHQYYWTPSIS